MPATSVNAGAKGGLGWAILFAALAVPGMLFYNWWTHLKTDREKTLSAKARGRIPEGGVFQAPPNSAQQVNPMTAAAAPVAAHAAPPASPAPAPAEPPPQGVAFAAPGVSTPVAAPATQAPPSLKRDPMISPFDYVRMKEEEDGRRLAQERLEDERTHKARRGARREPPPETLIDLQGIVSNPEGGSKAIVNNAVVGVGERVGKFRVLRITSTGVTFEYKKRRFTKRIGSE